MSNRGKRWYWVWAPEQADGRFHDVGIDKDGSLYNPNGYPERQLANERATMVNKKGQEVEVQPFRHWIEAPNRNTVPVIYFKPECSFRRDVPGLRYNAPLNLWRGYQYESVDPAKTPTARRAARMICRHLWVAWCDRDPVKYRWIMDWLAILVQEPERIGLPVPCLVSAQGAGKGIIVDNILVPLFGPHAIVLEKPDHLTGRFNSHLGVNAFISVNEAVWGGDKKQSGAYKAIVTDEMRMIEPKFRDAFMGKNYSSLLLSTNNDWFAPMDAQDRRHAVFDMNQEFKGDTKYFGRLKKAIVAENGRGALLHALLRRKVDITAFYKPPAWQSQAADTNMLRSVDPVYVFLHDWFSREVATCGDYTGRSAMAAEVAKYSGTLLSSRDTMGEPGWVLPLSHSTDSVFLKEDVYQAYLRHHAESGLGNAAGARDWFWRLFNRLQGVHTEVRPRVGSMRVRAITVAPAPALRAALGQVLGRDLSW